MKTRAGSATWDDKVLAYVASIQTDARLARHDIAGSAAHTRMLARQGIISRKQAGKILHGLKRLLNRFNNGKLRLSVKDEDIHTALERALTEIIGPDGGRVHAGRSRNDQVALDERLYMRDAAQATIGKLGGLAAALSALAKRNQRAVMPGFTHLQHAQPVLFALWTLAYRDMFDRDRQRFQDAFRRINRSPLGAAAMAGSNFPLDRESVARELGMSGVIANPMDAVSDRDAMLELLSASAICAMHLSRLAEELILWSSPEFGWIEIDKKFCTGSSIMPQKRNPDIAELVRGKSGRIYADLLGLLITMKGLPLTYNRDMQEDKHFLFDSCESLYSSLEMAEGMMLTLKIFPDRMRRACGEGFLLATDAADYLVRKDVPFRQAHAAVAKAVNHCRAADINLGDLKPADWREFHAKFGPDITRYLDLDAAVARRGQSRCVQGQLR